MSRSQRLLALCARQSFEAGERAAVERLAARGVRWPRVVAIARREGVLPIVARNLRRCDARALALPDGMSEALELAVLESTARREEELERVARDLHALREVELDAMLLKSAALWTGVYAQPWVTESRDVDVALRPHPGWAKDKGAERQVRRRLYRSYMECDLEGHHDVTLNGLLPLDFARIWREATPVALRGAPAWRMAPDDLLLSLCTNACRKRYLRLKPLFDLAETVRRGGPFDWPRIGTLARAARCAGVAHAALLAARTLLDAPVAEADLAMLAPGRLRAATHRIVLRAFSRWGAFGGVSATVAGMLLVYASLRPREGLRSAAGTLRRRRRRPAHPLP